jgi:hypothetical protein
MQSETPDPFHLRDASKALKMAISIALLVAGLAWAISSMFFSARTRYYPKAQNCGIASPAVFRKLGEGDISRGT